MGVLKGQRDPDRKANHLILSLNFNFLFSDSVYTIMWTNNNSNSNILTWHFTENRGLITGFMFCANDISSISLLVIYDGGHFFETINQISIITIWLTAYATAHKMRPKARSENIWLKIVIRLWIWQPQKRLGNSLNQSLSSKNELENKRALQFQHLVLTESSLILCMNISGKFQLWLWIFLSCFFLIH